ncbi:MAG: segregation/condensation protein A [Nanoarchaeota archaeon]|nr:segregation/condensation protein A [Nanoarchaeota archaeon]
MPEHSQRILDVVLDKSEITWQEVIYDLIKTDQMDPWDIDVSLLTKKYIDRVRTMKEHDFRISGKVVLAAALLLKIKSAKWIEEDIANLDALFSSTQNEMDELLDIGDEFVPREKIDAMLIPRTPQPRKRKLSIYDLVNALEKALEVKHRRVIRDMPDLEMEAPRKKRDISQIIRDLYTRILDFFNTKKEERLMFSKIAGEDRESKIYTFIPLLHLTNQGKIDITQAQHFGEIEIEIKN